MKSEGELTRGDFLKVSGGALGGAYLASLAFPGTALAKGEGSAVYGWNQVPAILARIRPPQFPAREFWITQYGAVGDGITDCTQAFAQAISDCSACGGGMVIVPAGVFFTGAIHLEDNVNLHVTSDATIKFSRDTSRYLPVVRTRFEGVELMNYSPLIYAYGRENIAITGCGTLDGRADYDHWWPWKGEKEDGWDEGEPNQEKDRDRLFEMAEQGVPVEERVFGEGHYLRSSFIQPYACKNVLIEGVTITNSPMWEMHPVLSSNITVRNVKVNSHGPNNDGCDPESCTDVHITGCYFDTGDDCIALKSGRNADGRRVDTPCQNVVVERCEMKDGHGGVVMGSEMTGGVQNVFVRNCRMSSPNLERALRIKTNSIRGGFVKNVYMKNVGVGQVSDAVIKVNFDYEEGDAGPYDPYVTNINVQDLSSGQSPYALYLVGYPDAPVQDVHLENVAFQNVEKQSVLENVQGLSFRNVIINGSYVEAPAT